MTIIEHTHTHTPLKLNQNVNGMKALIARYKESAVECLRRGFLRNRPIIIICSSSTTTEEAIIPGHSTAVIHRYKQSATINAAVHALEAIDRLLGWDFFPHNSKRKEII